MKPVTRSTTRAQLREKLPKRNVISRGSAGGCRASRSLEPASTRVPEPVS